MMWVQSSHSVAYRWSTPKLSVWKENTGRMAIQWVEKVSTLTTH